MFVNSFYSIQINIEVEIGIRAEMNITRQNVNNNTVAFVCFRR